VQPTPADVAIPEPQEVEAVVALRDPVLRNLRITECYYRLSRAMSARTGACSNWCTFAVWASRQAGRTIRGEDLLERFKSYALVDSSLLHPIEALWRVLVRRGVFHPGTALGRFVQQVHSPFDAFELASDAVARGNLKVFAEIGLEFARYLRDCPADAPVDSEPMKSFLARLRPGDPPDGQDYLRRAFTRYQAQGFADEAGVRAGLISMANLEIGIHEQTRLQPEIREALEAAPAAAAGLLGNVIWGLRRFSRDLSRLAITECMMVIVLPGNVLLPLGLHLDRPFSDDLRNVRDPEFLQLIERYEPANGGADDCGASDWAVLTERLHYISHFFRVFHASPGFLEAPFTREQIRKIRDGRIPDGIL
jgi:hypothetical protein